VTIPCPILLELPAGVFDSSDRKVPPAYKAFRKKNNFEEIATYMNSLIVTVILYEFFK
jgi:hypothetical protein